ncbi:MAG: CDP-glucose 4,6-dehydratase [Bacteriovoracaceae bacterium]|nr:CDP-glucose 4,6-dehydratase [Bacteriovoracaceae bacterium]
MESLVEKRLFKGIYQGKKVFVTGHTGFKGTWLCLWLKSLGAEVMGYSLNPPTTPNHYEALDLGIHSTIDDVRNRQKLKKVMGEFRPDIVFHMAAQPLVRLSYQEPVETMEINIIGTLNVYEAVKNTSSVKAIVSITTDKVYENKEWVWGYREEDVLGGKDPYSASKAAMEVVTSSYRHSFFNLKEYGKSHETLLSTVRAGNVIGGGDWAQDRLIPDIVKASVAGETVSIRSPYSTRPWQHVLEPLSGYLLLGQKLLEREIGFADSMNFGPAPDEDISVEKVVNILKKYWNRISYKIERPKDILHEAGLLKLDCTKARVQLNWNPVWNAEKALSETIEWYKSFYENNKIESFNNLNDFINDSSKQGEIWTIGE